MIFVINKNNIVIVNTRKNGHESSLPLPSQLGIKTHQRYLVKVNKHGDIFGKPQKSSRNIFANPKLTRKDFINSMNACGLNFGQNISIGKEW